MNRFIPNSLERSPRLRDGNGWRRGSATLEAIIVVPVLVIIIVAAVEFGIVLGVEQSIAHAATVAAREAAKGASADELEDVVNAILAPHQLAVGSSVAFALEVGGPPTTTERRPIATTICDPPTTATVAADEVRVTICVQLNTAPFPNFLSAFGVDISNRSVRRSSLVKKE